MMHLDKRNTFSNDLIFIDGLWGTGKSLLAPIISNMREVEKVKVESIYEYVSWLFYLGKINEDGAIWLLRTYADCSQYHNVIGREINLRWRDDTGLKNVIGKLKLIKRLLGSEGDSKVEEINQKNIAFCAMSHMLMLAPELLTQTYGNRIKIIEVVRHPLYMLNHFKAYFSRFESSREFTISFYYKDNKIPWFMNGLEENFIHRNDVEKAVLCISHLYPWLEKKIEQSRSANLAVLEVSFEDVVFETNNAMLKLEKFLERSHHGCLSSILKKQKLPRKNISNGAGHANYGWKKSSNSEKESYQDLLSQLTKNCSNEMQDKMHKTIAWYNKKYPSKLNIFG